MTTGVSATNVKLDLAQGYCSIEMYLFCSEVLTFCQYYSVHYEINLAVILLHKTLKCGNSPALNKKPKVLDENNRHKPCMNLCNMDLVAK